MLKKILITILSLVIVGSTFVVGSYMGYKEAYTDTVNAVYVLCLKGEPMKFAVENGQFVCKRVQSYTE